MMPKALSFPVVDVAVIEDVHELTEFGVLLPLVQQMFYRNRQIVITSRCTDTVAALAPQMDEFEWGLITGIEADGGAGWARRSLKLCEPRD